MIRRVVAFVAILALMRCASSADSPISAPSFEHLDECPNPVIENMYWLLVEGRVVEVTSVRTFRLRTDAGEVLDISLANVGEPFDSEALSTLRGMIDGKRVSVMKRPSLDEQKSFAAEVQVGTGRDLSRELLRAGAAAFIEEPAYTLSTYSECLHRIAAREAKAEGLGVWHRQ